MTTYAELQARVIAESKTWWLVTGIAEFICSNLLETLLTLKQRLGGRGLKTLSTGRRHSFDEVQPTTLPELWANFRFTEGDICNLTDCQQACQGVAYVLHHVGSGQCHAVLPVKYDKRQQYRFF